MHGRSVTALVIDSATEVAKAFFDGRCKAYTSDVAQLTSVRARSPGGREAFVILPERISKEPFGPVVRAGDVEWASLVRWVVHVLVAAEEHGVTRGNVDAISKQMQGAAAWRVFSGKDDRVARALGVHADWAARVIRTTGNYAELYERNLGQSSGLGFERGLNRLWTQGGLLYAPPLD
jgi:general L-amino acid transport system substrate-binding protein